MVANMVADMEVDKSADMVADKVANMMVIMEVDKVADKKWIRTHGKKRMGEQNGLQEHLVSFFENTWYIYLHWHRVQCILHIMSSSTCNEIGE